MTYGSSPTTIFLSQVQKICKRWKSKSKFFSGEFKRPAEQFLPKIHIDLNRDYMNRILPAIGNEVLKSVVAQYDAEQLLKNREKIAKEIKDSLVGLADE